VLASIAAGPIAAARWLTAALAVAAIGLAACGDDNGGEVRTVTVPAEAEQDAPVIGDAILIETRISNAKHHTGEVLDGSFSAESAFCPGGKTTGGSTGPTIITTFRCPDGRLKIPSHRCNQAWSRAPSGRS